MERIVALVNTLLGFLIAIALLLASLLFVPLN